MTNWLPLTNGETNGVDARRVRASFGILRFHF